MTLIIQDNKPYVHLPIQDFPDLIVGDVTKLTSSQVSKLLIRPYDEWAKSENPALSQLQIKFKVHYVGYDNYQTEVRFT